MIKVATKRTFRHVMILNLFTLFPKQNGNAFLFSRWFSIIEAKPKQLFDDMINLSIACNFIVKPKTMPYV